MENTTSRRAFYHIAICRTWLIRNWGKLGSKGQVKQQNLGTWQACVMKARELERTRTGRDYRVIYANRDSTAWTSQTGSQAERDAALDVMRERQAQRGYVRQAREQYERELREVVAEHLARYSVPSVVVTAIAGSWTCEECGSTFDTQPRTCFRCGAPSRGRVEAFSGRAAQIRDQATRRAADEALRLQGQREAANPTPAERGVIVAPVSGRRLEVTTTKARADPEPQQEEEQPETFNWGRIGTVTVLASERELELDDD